MHKYEITSPDLIGQKLQNDQYVVESFLGEKNFCQAYVLNDLQHGNNIKKVMKIVPNEDNDNDTEAASKCKNKEFHRLKNLDDPNVIKYYDCFQLAIPHFEGTNVKLCIISELCVKKKFFKYFYKIIKCLLIFFLNRKRIYKMLFTNLNFF